MLLLIPSPYHRCAKAGKISKDTNPQNQEGGCLCGFAIVVISLNIMDDGKLVLSGTWLQFFSSPTRLTIIEIQRL